MCDVGWPGWLAGGSRGRERGRDNEGVCADLTVLRLAIRKSRRDASPDWVDLHV